MKRILMCVITVFLAACAAPGPGNLKPGASSSDITAQMGTPRATYALPNGGKRLEFSGSAARTYMIDVDASGRLVDVVQVLNTDNFMNIRAGMTPEQVLMTLGQPDENRSLGRQGGELWTYNFQNTQCQMFQVIIGADGRTTGPGSQALLPPCRNAP